jgi:hypothetical protein
MFKDNLEEISNNEKVIGLYDSELAKEYENNCIKEEHEKAAHYEHCQKVCTVTGCIGIGGMARIFRL